MLNVQTVSSKPVQNAVYFQYMGFQKLVIKGKITGVEYYFKENGSIVGVDYRDSPQLSELSIIKKM